MDMTVVAFTGIRAIEDIMADEVELTVLDEIGSGATELRFGGALGSDTLALEAACEQDVRRVVYVPFLLRDQPREAREVAADCADEIIELRLRKGQRGAYFQRNRALIDGADRVVGFWDGRRGGTEYTLQTAQRLGTPISVVLVRGKDPKHNPQLRGVEFSGPVYALSEYVSARDGQHRLSELVRANKTGDADPRKLQDLALQLSDFIERTPALAQAKGLVAMPRRQPGADSDMDVLAKAVARLRGLDVHCLERLEEPLGGVEEARRLRFPALEHARTLRYYGPVGMTVIVLDNVVTTGGTMEGALQAVDAGGATPLGLAILFSESFDLEPF